MRFQPHFHRNRKYGPFGRRFGRYPFFSAAQVKKSEEAYTLTFEVPGVTKEDIQLEITQDELWLNAKNDELKRKYREHLYFQEPIDPNKVSANLKAGILTIVAPYATKKPKTKVNIE
jgi:HSP20 family molecular chaperone IbpA